jgi:hypothetical protein
MDREESISDQPNAAGEAAAAPETAGAIEIIMPKMALAVIEVPSAGLSKRAGSACDIPQLEDAIVEAPKIELASIAAPQIAPDLDEEKRPSQQDGTEAADGDAASEPPADHAPRMSRFTVLAASLALAAALGGMGGVLGASSFMRPPTAIIAAGAKTGLEEIHALKENIVLARAEIAALKVSVDAGIRNASAQFTKLGERIDRVERIQAEPVAKLSKAVETLDRLARSETAGQATGSITPPPATGGANAGVVEGWVVRDVYRGTALIEGRMGMIEVDKGDTVPGLGRVDAIRKQDGRWVVVTSKGLIMPSR